MSIKKRRPFISFFSGIEGFRLGLEASGWRCVRSVEIDDFCGRVQKARYGHGPQETDINKVSAKKLPYADLWVAGWPCQGLSVAGLRKGLADDRSGLFWQFVRLLEQKRPGRFLAENVPGLLTTCSCSRCGFQCKDCGAQAGADDEVCEPCGSENLGGRVLPAHRGNDLFVVLTALQRIGYGVQTRILDAQYLGVPQRRRRIFFVGCLGAPCSPEILFESEGSGWDPAQGGEKGKIAAGKLARSVGGVGGGNDYGAGKGNLVGDRRENSGRARGHNKEGADRRKTASAITASAGHHGHSSPRGDGTDNLVAATLGKNHKSDRGQPRENLVAGTIQSCSGDQGRKTPEVDHLVASSEKAHTLSKGTGGGLGGRDGQDDYVVIRIDQTRADPVVRRKGVTDSIATGTGHGGYANQAIARREAEVFETRFARNGRGKPSRVAPPLKAQSGRTGKGDAAPCVIGPALAAPLTARSNPNSNAAGRRREDDQNIVVSGTSQTVSPCLDTTFNRTGRGRTEAERLVVQKKVAPTVTHHFERTGGETEASRLIQQPLFIHTADAGANQNQVKKDGKADCLSKAQPGAVAIPFVKRGRAHHDDGETWGDAGPAPTINGSDYGGPARATAVAVDPTPMSVRRLTPTEAERLQGFPDGWSCLCQVRPDCPDRRIPPWLDPTTFKLGGCGHSACGCQCPDSPRYKSLGNAVATCVVEWIGRRIPVKNVIWRVR